MTHRRAGCDIASLERVARLRKRYDATFLAEVFTPSELARSDSELAMAFAVKEAFLKAVGTGSVAGMPLRNVEVALAEGAAEIRVTGALTAVMRLFKVDARSRIHNGHAVATVILSPRAHG
ncbi:MAG: 4'-phosphopantetheinyl transferase superfamily protein [Actinomycetota bacterium]|nr:4'-phosphopantetheinyl transferase superfamily protein [Actinomycetota bacterium]